jgi:hypothetical protein
MLNLLSVQRWLLGVKVICGRANAHLAPIRLAKRRLIDISIDEDGVIVPTPICFEFDCGKFRRCICLRHTPSLINSES